MNETKMKQIMFNLFDEYEEYDDIIDALRDMNCYDQVSDEEYDYCLEHWDEMLEQWTNRK